VEKIQTDPNAALAEALAKAKAGAIKAGIPMTPAEETIFVAAFKIGWVGGVRSVQNR
jgi:hypothetical protein